MRWEVNELLENIFQLFYNNFQKQFFDVFYNKNLFDKMFYITDKFKTFQIFCYKKNITKLFLKIIVKKLENILYQFANFPSHLSCKTLN